MLASSLSSPRNVSRTSSTEVPEEPKVTHPEMVPVDWQKPIAVSAFWYDVLPYDALSPA